METLVRQICDISVDQIIERVLIRSNQNHYDYNHKHQHNLTPQEHIWHFQLQQENLQLKNKLLKLKNTLKKREEQLHKQTNLQKQLQQLKDELESVLHQNQQLQNGINKLRLKNTQNSHINQSLQDSLEDSLRHKKTNRQCSCTSEGNLPRSSPNKNILSKDKILHIIESPKKEILKMSKEVSILCKMDANATFAEQRNQKINDKKKHIVFLQQMIKNQSKILEQYEREINSRNKQGLDKKPTQPSTERLYPLIRPTSVKMFQSPPSAAGSIVKIKRH